MLYLSLDPWSMFLLPHVKGAQHMLVELKYTLP